ncbi:COG2426 family protein [Anaerosalibacter bizertensis]|uniref:COG2426 family protein n=1 Tax=Anaerosalibacter bizertensis TaxID=932217 RepID=UPI001C0F1FE0|nr:small multi-drug export protein [Anaerosalibacter bizertensis]MBU5293064.1 small multi-drug export protein [Anaerosalibacter bizertensis]
MLDILETIKDEIIVMFVAAMPLVELRGAIPLGISMGFTPLESTVLSIIGNIIPVPFLLRLLEPIMDYLEKTTLFSKLVKKVKKRTLKKSRDKIKKYSLLGLFILVAVPIPTTGAWTGCIAATLLKLDPRKALVSIVSGIIAAGIIVFSLSYKVISVF